ncbi:hypothetical protein J4410_06610 [Candidatus Woesearchaeota archaeon]|nr:hypothetical protein [Candidatus Woesearchaeota archaeon]
MIYIIDSYAWVEYFLGSKKGEILKKLFLDSQNRFLTVECCLAEIKGWTLKNNQNFDEILKIIRANSTIMKIEEKDWISAAEHRFTQRKTQSDFGLIDAVLLTKQQALQCLIISRDKHFRGLKNVVFMG